MRAYGPCRRRDVETCPYLMWRSGAPRPADIVGHGPDRYDQARYRCKLCKKTFLEPAHHPETFHRFRVYQRAEALVAVSNLGESISVVAARLFVSERTVSRWLRRWRQQRKDNPAKAPRPGLYCDLPEDRWYRRVGVLKDAPYVVDGQDLHRYQKASYGELRYWLLREGLSTEEDLADWDKVILDSYRLPEERGVVVDQARQLLLTARRRLRRDRYL